MSCLRPDAVKHAVLVFCKSLEVVDQIDQEKFLRCNGWKIGFHPKIVNAVSELEAAMTLPVVNDGFIIKLRGADAERIIDIGRQHQEPLVLEKRFDEIVVVSRSTAEGRGFRTQIDTAGEFGQFSGIL